MLKVAKVVGLNSDQSAAQVLIHHLSFSELPDKVDNLLSQSSLFIVTRCTLEDAFSKTRQALSEAEDLYYSSSEQVSQRIEQVLAVIKKSLAEAADLEVLIASTYQEGLSARVLYLLCEGQNLSALLLRDGETVNLCQMVSGNKMISGFLKPGDRLILTTNNLLELFGDNQGLWSTSLETLEDEIVSSLPHDKINPLAAVILEEEDLAPKVKEPDLTLPSILSQHLAQNTPQPSSTHQGRPFKLKKLWLPLIAILLVGALGWLVYLKRAAIPKLFSQSSTSTQSNSSNLSPRPASDPNIIQLSNLPLWLDLNLIKDGFAPTQLSAYQDQLLLLDQSSQTLITISLANKSYQILAGQDKLGQAKQISLNSSSAWVYSQDKGLLRIDTGSQKILDTISPDKDWGEIGSIAGFASNIYILDKAKNQIWKYVPIAKGFSDKVSYLSADTQADFKDASGMVIDGSVWVFKPSGQILKFTQGVKDSFNLSGIQPPLSGLNNLFLSDETDNLYLLDQAGKRVVVADKKGNYLYQIVSDQLGQAEAVVADEKTKKLYLLSSGKIYTADLK